MVQVFKRVEGGKDEHGRRPGQVLWSLGYVREANGQKITRSLRISFQSPFQFSSPSSAYSYDDPCATSATLFSPLFRLSLSTALGDLVLFNTLVLGDSQNSG